MKILLIGDIVGSPGRMAVARCVPRWRAEGKADFVVANAENAAAGRGLTGALAEELFAAGVDAITLGDHTWDQKELQAVLDREPRILRPANFHPDCPGRGCGTFDGPDGVRITVINLIGRVFLKPADCPFRKADELLAKEPDLGRIILVDMHAEATSEKIAIGRYLDGRVTSVTGTHTHVQTSDDAILPKGTAYLTDLGMTGPKDSVLGRELDAILKTMITGLPTKFDVARDDVALEGVFLDVDVRTGRARSIKRVREKIENG